MVGSKRRDFLTKAALAGLAAGTLPTFRGFAQGRNGSVEGPGDPKTGGPRLGRVPLQPPGKNKPIRTDEFAFGIAGIGEFDVDWLRGGTLRLEVICNDRPDGGLDMQYGGYVIDDLAVAVRPGPNIDRLQKWLEQGDRRDATLFLLARDKSTVLRTINYFGCYPTSCNAGDHSTASEIKSITFTCNVDRIEETKG